MTNIVEGSINKLISKNGRKILKCSWCNEPRFRNDLCNSCRQKVESRARRLIKKKLIGDMDVIQNTMEFMVNNILNKNEFKNISAIEFYKLVVDTIPFVVKFYKSGSVYLCVCMVIFV